MPDASAEAAAHELLLWEADQQRRTKSPDTPENFKAVWAEIAPKVVAGALPFRQPIPVPNTPKPRVGFFVGSPAMLAHTVNLRTLVQGLASIDNPIEPFVYLSHAPSDSADFIAAFPNARFCMGNSVYQNWATIRAQSIADGLSAMVFVSNPTGMAFASTMAVAPRHIWWAHKWHGLWLPHVDGYLDACHPFLDRITIDGRPWRCTYTALPEMFAPDKSAAAAKLRAQSSASILFGTLVREEKLTPDFAAVVRRILDGAKGATYVYAGKSRQDWFERALAPHRVHFIGWVDTRLWAQVLDVYLDTFPLQSGHTAFEAMAASRPVVWLHNPSQADEQGVTDVIRQRWHGAFAADPVADTVDAYVARALALAGDADLRKREGAAGRMFYDRHLRDEARMARSVADAVIEIVNAPPASG